MDTKKIHPKGKHTAENFDIFEQYPSGPLKSKRRLQKTFFSDFDNDQGAAGRYVLFPLMLG